MEILVFKTNIGYKKHIIQIMPHLERVDGIKEWNVYLKDRDKILRIEAFNIIPSAIENIVQNAGYYCEELQD